MYFDQPSLHLLSIWRIRLVIVCIVPAFLSAYFVARFFWFGLIFTTCWVLAFFYFYIFYYPIKLRKLAYSRNKRCMLIHCGVIYTRVKALPIYNIQYTGISVTPLERFFGICTLVLYAAGAKAYMPGLTPERARRLQDFLTGTRKEQKSPCDFSDTVPPGTDSQGQKKGKCNG